MESLWSKNQSNTTYPTIEGNIKTNVCIIGGGIAGLLTAYLLKEKNIDCLIIEANQILHGVTQNTTAKITCQHGLIYHKIQKQFGLEQAQQYGFANRKALDMYKKIISQKAIDCGFEEIPTYLYTNKNIKKLENELKAMQAVKFDGYISDQSALPFRVRATLKMEKQAQFNPLKFLHTISKGLSIFENSPALSVNGKIVQTPKGKITANTIVVATHFPFINVPGYYFMRMHQERSYAIAIENGAKLDGAYIGIDDIKYSFRSYKNITIIGGGEHRTGENKNNPYLKLSGRTKEFYAESHEICRWSAQDCMTHDSIPFIGKYFSTIDNLYVATGFNKWGMTSAMTAAMLLSDEISGKPNDCAAVFSPRRHNLLPSIKGLSVDGTKSTANLLKQIFYLPSEKISEIAIGHGGVVNYKNNKVGVYRKSKDEIYMVSTKCPHLGCQLAWNQGELSWDCPCHGSRFNHRGKKLDNPSQKDLKAREGLKK